MLVYGFDAHTEMSAFSLRNWRSYKGTNPAVKPLM